MLKLLAGRVARLIVPVGSRQISLSSSSFSKNEDNQTSESLKKVLLTEDLPPIPPDLGFPGDDNVRTLFEMKRIRQSFRYGEPPNMFRRPNPGHFVIRLLPITHCSNRHFFRIAVTRYNFEKADGFIEDIGSFDPLPNKENKFMVAINVERLKYWLGRQVPISNAVGQLLGLSGFLPVHPQSYLKAYNNRLAIQKQEAELKKAKEEAEKAVAEKGAVKS